MKTNIFRTLVLLFLSASLFTACDSDDDEDTTLTREELLTAETWRGDKILVNKADPSIIPGAAAYVPDPKSITIKFDKDGTYTAEYTQNGQPFQTEGNWEFTDNERKISGQFFNFPASEADIEELSATNLTLSTTVQLPNLPIPLLAEVQMVR